MSPARRKRQSRAATVLEVGPGLGAAIAILITVRRAMTHKPAAVHCNRHIAESCIGQVTAYSFQTYVLAAGIGAVIGLVLVTMILIAWRAVARTPAAAKP